MSRNKKSDRCPGSHVFQGLAWAPDDKGYPGAGVCIECSLGVQCLKGSARMAEAQDGITKWFGTLKVHNRPVD